MGQAFQPAKHGKFRLGAVADPWLPEMQRMLRRLSVVHRVPSRLENGTVREFRSPHHRITDAPHVHQVNTELCFLTSVPNVWYFGLTGRGQSVMQCPSECGGGDAIVARSGDLPQRWSCIGHNFGYAPTTTGVAVASALWQFRRGNDFSRCGEMPGENRGGAPFNLG